MAVPSRPRARRVLLSVERLEERSLLAAYVSPYALAPLNPQWTGNIGNLTTDLQQLYQVAANTLPPANIPSSWYDPNGYYPNFTGPLNQGVGWGPQPAA
jgi:hypothetical protein